MARACRSLLLAGFALGVLAGPSAAQTAPVVTFSGGSLYHTESVPPNTIKTFTVTCPPGFVAVGGATSVAGGGVTRLKSSPGPGARAWTFSYGAPVTNPATEHVTVVVTCVRPKKLVGVKGVLKLSLKSKNVKSNPVVVPPGGSEDTKLKCPGGYAPAGPGTNTGSGAAPKSRARAAAVLPPGLAPRLTRVMPVRGGFEFTDWNPSDSEQTVRHSARCLKRKASARRRRRPRRVRAPAEVTRGSFEEMLDPGFGVFEHKCGRRRGRKQLPLSSGFGLPRGMDALVRTQSFDPPRMAGWVIQNGEPHRLVIDLFLLCVPGRLSFKRDV